MHMENMSVDQAAAVAGNHGPVPGRGVRGPGAGHHGGRVHGRRHLGPGTDDTYALGDTIEVGLTFSETPRRGFSYKTLWDHALTVTGARWSGRAGWRRARTPGGGPTSDRTPTLRQPSCCPPPRTAGPTAPSARGTAGCCPGRVELTAVPKGRVDAVARQLSRPGNGSPVAMYPTSKSWR